MNVFLTTVGVFCVLHIVPAHPWLAPPITQWLEVLEAKETEGYSPPTEYGTRLKRLKQLLEQVKKIAAEQEQAEKKLEEMMGKFEYLE